MRKAAVYAVPNLLLLGLLALCLPVFLRGRSRLPPEALPFAAFAFVTFSFHSALSAEARMLLPVIPVLLCFLVYAVAKLNALPLPLAVRRTGGIPMPTSK